jgi:transposase
LDIHKRFVVACLLVTDPAGTLRKDIRTYSTMTADLLALCDWLCAEQCTQVVMESTASYWRPISNLLEGHVELLVVNAAHVKAATTDSLQWKHGGLGNPGRGDRSDPCFVRPAIAVA